MSSFPRAVVRADAGPRIGSGHVMRCLSLAKALNESGWAVSLLSIDLPEAQRALWACPGRDVIDLPSSLEAGSGQDAALTAEHMLRQEAQALIVDHYGLDLDWEQAANPEQRTSLAIDDPPLRRHRTDWVLNPNLVETPSRPSSGGPEFLEGARFALLRPEFVQLRNAKPARPVGPVRRLLINLGGYDPQGYTWPVVQRCSALFAAELTLDVVIGPGNPDLEALRDWASEHENRLLTVQAADMAARMSAADLAVGAGGSSAWERCSLGLPTVTVVLAENQRTSVRLGHRAGVLVDGGDLRAANGLESVAEALRLLRDDAAARERMAQAGKALVDGQGAGRVAARLTKNSGSIKA